MPVQQFFIDHPASVGETYREHFASASSFSRAMFRAAICCAIHAVFPFLFEKTGSQIIVELNDQMVLNRSRLNPEFE